MKWYINWLGIRGVNLFVPHAFYYSVAGARKEERPPDVGANNIWWQHYHLFSDYMKCISYLMTDSVSFARVAVLCDNNRVPAEEVAGLYEHQIGFHYLPIAMLGNCAIEEGKLCIGSCQFDVVVDLYGYRENKDYAKSLEGVQIVSETAALYPRGNYRSMYDEGGRRNMAGQAGTFNLEKIGQCEVNGRDYRTVVIENDCPWLRVVHMEKEGIQWYLFSNEGEDTIETNIFIRELQEDKKPVWIDLWDICTEDSAYFAATYEKKYCVRSKTKQQILQNYNSCIGLRLEHCEMKLLLLLNKNEDKIVEKYWSKLASVNAVKRVFLGDWTDKFASADTDTGSFKNTVSYQYTYVIPEGKTITGAEYFTVCGEEMAECVCNGTFVGVSFYTPHTFRIGHLLKQGKNEICLRFTGNAVNLYGTVKVPFGLELV